MAIVGSGVGSWNKSTSCAFCGRVGRRGAGGGVTDVAASGVGGRVLRWFEDYSRYDHRRIEREWTPCRAINVGVDPGRFCFPSRWCSGGSGTSIYGRVHHRCVFVLVILRVLGIVAHHIFRV